MPKILFIEDELTQNVSAIIKFFAPFLTEQTMQDLLNSDFDYSEEIIQACSYSSILDIAHTFPMALEKIIKYHKLYDFILIDRNLEFDQSPDELKRVCDLLTELGLTDIEERINGFKNKEGDLLLQVLLSKKEDYTGETYFLTANAKELIKESERFQWMIDSNQYPIDHIIEKGSPQESVISDKLSDLPSLTIQKDFKPQCEIIRKRLGEVWVKKFIKMVQYYRDGNKEECILFLRMLLGNKILKEIALKLNEPLAPYWNEKNKRQLVVKGFVKGFKVFDHITRQTTQWGLPAYNDKHDIGYNSIVRNACLSIAEICSDSIHGDFDDFEKDVSPEDVDTSSLTPYTMRTLLNQICDIMIWYNKSIDVLSGID